MFSVAIVFLFLGIFIGMLSQIFRQNRELLSAYRTMKSYVSPVFWYLYIAMVSYLLWKNWEPIAHPQKFESFNAFRNYLFTIQANIQFITFGVFFALAGVLSIVLRLPFANWEQIKIFGFEYKRFAEATEEAAKEELKEAKEIHFIQNQILSGLASEENYDNIVEFCEEGMIDEFALLKSTMAVIRHTYYKGLGREMICGVLSVLTGQLNPDEIKSLPAGICVAVTTAFHLKKEYVVNENDSGTVVVPVKIGNQDSYLVYMHAKSCSFSDADKSFLTAVGSIIRAQLDIFVLHLRRETE